MKKFYTLMLALFAAIAVHAADVAYTIKLTTAGTLKEQLTTAGNLTTITQLTITGNIDARDINTMKVSMTALTYIDMSGAVIQEYTGMEGTGSTTTDVTYPANTLPVSAFKSNYKLKNISLPQSLTTIGSYSLSDCQLTQITLPPNVTKIESHAFYRCDKMTSIVISPKVTTIEDFAFTHFNGMFEVSADNPNYSSLDGILYNKDKTSLILCPTSKTGIVSIPNSVKTIVRYAFHSCKSIAEIQIPSSVNYIQLETLMYCPALINVDVQNAYYSSIDGVLYNKTQTTLIACPTSITGILTLPTTVTSIGYNSCVQDHLDEIVLPDNLKLITNSWLQGGTLKKINIPAGITTITNYAMYQCSKMECINSELTTPFNLATYAIDVNKTKCLLFIPAGTKAAYLAATGWKDFTNIIEGPGFGLSFDQTIAAKAVSSSFKIYSNLATACSISKNVEATWLKLEQSEATAGDATISYTADANTTSQSRVATITVTAEGVSKQIIITQEKPWLYTNSNEVTFLANDIRTITTSVSTNTTWSASTSSGWIHFTIEGNNISITADENLLKTVRSGTISFKVPGVTRTLTVTQSGATTTSAINEKSSKSTLTLYPNPTIDGFTINNLETPANLTITDLTGRTLLSTQVTNDEYVNINHLKAGIYIVNINHRSYKLIKK